MKLKRVNLLIDLHFWALKPYTDVIQYNINSKTYYPISYRFLCFALVLLKEEDSDVLNIRHKDKLKKVLNAKTDKDRG